MSQDITNALFELFAGIMIFNHCRVLMADKHVAGVSTLSTVFFLLVGIWNLYYYPHLEQWYSLIAGTTVVTSNGLYIYLLLKYKR